MFSSEMEWNEVEFTQVVHFSITEETEHYEHCKDRCCVGLNYTVYLIKSSSNLFVHKNFTFSVSVSFVPRGQNRCVQSWIPNSC